MAQLGIGKGPLAPWTVKEMLSELGFDKALETGQVKVGDNGEVVVRQADGEKVAFAGALHTKAELDAMLKALGKVAKPDQTSTTAALGQKPHEVLIRARASQVENRVNDRLWYGVKLQTDLLPEYRMGQRFDLPFKALKPGDGEIMTVGFKSKLVDAMKKIVAKDDGTVMCPVHPQEMSFRGMTEADAELPGVRCASSERTVHAGLPGVPDLMIKLDLGHILHSMVKRPIDRGGANGALRMTEFLHAWVDDFKVKNDPFCFFPEVMAIVDTGANAAAIVRDPKPYPPHPSGETWVIPMYSLSAHDQDFPNEPPPLIRMIKDRPDQSVSAVDDFAQRFMKPLIDSALRAYLDLGAACQMHGQNSYLELGGDGQPTGRVAHGDLESFWPRPEAAKLTGRKDFFEATGIPFTECRDADVWTNFQAHFLTNNLEPLVKCFAEHFPEEAQAAREKMMALLKEGVQARRAVVEPLQYTALRGFGGYLT